MELIQLLEVEIDSWSSGREVRTYEIYSCDKIKAVTLSANSYWHDRADMEKLGISEENVLDRAKFWASSDGGYVGGWETHEDMMYFFTFYLRGTILESVEA